MSEQIVQTTTNRILGDVATVEDQIKEDELAIAKNASDVLKYQDAIRAIKDNTKMREQRIRRNRKRKSVFLRAKTELEVIDVEVE